MRRGHSPTSTFGDVPMIWGWDSPCCVSFQSVPGEVEKDVTPPLTRISITIIIFHSISLFKLFIYSKLFVLISTAPVADQRSVSTSKVSASASRAWTTTGRLWSTSKWRLGQGHLDNEYNLFTLLYIYIYIYICCDYHNDCYYVYI